MATSQDFVTWTCGDALDPLFLMRAIQAEGESIRAFGEGSTHTTIYFPELKALHLLTPPVNEQRRIVVKIDNLSARSKRAREELAKCSGLEAASARTLLDRLDQAILAKAFRGELVPQDAADEPASVLLERLRAEREAAPAPKRRGRKRAAAAAP